MRTITRYNGVIIDLNQQQTISGNQYPAGALIGREAEFGIEVVQVADYPDARGYTWVEHDDGTLTITAIPLAEVIAARQAEVIALAAHKRNTVVGNTAPAEMSSWPIKRAEALAYASSGNAADAPNLIIEASSRGVSLNEIAYRVQANATALLNIEMEISGVCGKHRDAIGLLGTVDAVLAHDITIGWPV